jgi:uncharacterized protein YqjF (DUF2071 family)
LSRYEQGLRARGAAAIRARHRVGITAGHQNWRRLLFAHWPVPVADLRPLVPRCLTIDTYEGTAFVGLIPFVVQAARPVGAPPALGIEFLETNVRTYVHLDDSEPGVFFFSLDAGSALAVIGARFSLGLPYFWAAGRERVSDNAVDYVLRRRGGARPSVHLRYHVGEHLGPAEPGTLEHFLVERYRFHQQRGPTLWTVEVAHQPYPLQRAHVQILEDELVGAARIRVPDTPPLVHFASGVDVRVFAPRVRPLRPEA